MYVNGPTGAVRPATPEIGQARDESASAAPPARVFAAHACASASTLLASAGARDGMNAAAASAAIPRIPFHTLRTSGVAEPAFVAIPDNDAMSVIAGYLEQTDQLALRTLGGSLRKAVARSVETLSLDLHGAIDLFKEGHAFPNLKTLHLSNWQPKDLAPLARALQGAKQPAFELHLSASSVTVCNAAQGETRDLEHALSMNLSMLSLDGFAITSGLADALGRAQFAIELKGVSKDNTPDYGVHPITHIPTLVSWTIVDDDDLSDAAAFAIQSHPALRKLICNDVLPEQLGRILANPGLETLSFADYFESTEAERDKAFTALANHARLTSLNTGYTSTLLIESLSRNITISTLNLYIDAADSKSAVPSLANMPSLRNLILRTELDFDDQDAGLKLSASDLRAVCEKTLDSLDLSKAHLDPTALTVAAGANARHIAFGWHCGGFDQAAMDGLTANPHVSSVSIHTSCAASGASAERLAASPTITRLHLNIRSATDTTERIITAWRTAGKPLIDLKCSISPIEKA